ncbi:polysaccharide biosynthesis C-terminal domain-containing protein [Qipengyuania flava]|uniref:oligosaccharide flippase family protein n=1 Tax=Qipengyuania flava TaxID=192812 RepID=UPI00141AFE60|nr:polysaccharide biosynthesis C-terminal domain-containing protein [Qipengyuania flava]NIJ60563.1 O-antigen/teichoic acid export membrane protein [Qipengyuania flava]
MRLKIFLTAVQRFASVGIGVLTTVLLTNVMIAEQYGYYVYVLGLLALVIVPSQIGIPQFVLRETVRSIEAQDDVATRSVIRWGYIVVTLAGSIVVMGLMAFAHYWAPPSLGYLIILAAPLVLLTSWNAIRASILRSHGWTARSQFPENIVKPLVLLLVVLALVIINSDEITARQAILANVIAMGVSFLLGVWLVQKIGARRRTSSARYNHRVWLTATLGLGFSAALQAISLNLNVVLLGGLGRIEEVAVFKVASLIGGQVGIVLQIANIVIAKHVGAALQRGETKEVERLLARCSFFSSTASFFIVVCIIAFGKAILSVAFPPIYKDAYLAMVILAASQFLNCMTGSVALLFNLARREWVITAALLASTLINITLNLALIPKFGIEGAAFASLASLLSWNILLYVRARNSLSMDVGFIAGLKDYMGHSKLWPNQR